MDFRRGKRMMKIKNFVMDHFEGSLITLVFLGAIAIAFLVHYKFSFLNFFFLPVILSGYFLGRKRAVLISFFCILLVILYLLFVQLITGNNEILSLDEIINLISWGGFLILIAAVIGGASEQRESKIANLRRAYIGVTEILFKYLECADEMKPYSLRVSLLAGKIAATVGLDRREVENIKSAALLAEAGNLLSNIHLFEEVTEFLETGPKIAESPLNDREKVMLKATVALLKEVEPLLTNFFCFYIEEADILDKNLEEVPIGSSIIALANIYDKIETNAPPFQGKEEYNSISNVMKLAGRTFHSSAVHALQLVVSV